MNLKKEKPKKHQPNKYQSLSPPSGAQQQTHHSQIFLSVLIISKDTSHCQEKALSLVSETLWNES